MRDVLLSGKECFSRLSGKNCHDRARSRCQGRSPAQRGRRVAARLDGGEHTVMRAGPTVRVVDVDCSTRLRTPVDSTSTNATPADRRGCSHSAKSPGPRLRSLLSPPVRVLSRSDRGGPSRSRRVAGHRLGRLLGSPVRTGPGPSRLRRLTSVRCRNPPFLLSPIPRLVGSVASRCRVRRSTASRRLRPDRPGLPVHGRASAPRTARTGSCRWSRSTRRAFLPRRI